jgi:hypothetical protein
MYRLTASRDDRCDHRWPAPRTSAIAAATASAASTIANRRRLNTGPCVEADSTRVYCRPGTEIRQVGALAQARLSSCEIAAKATNRRAPAPKPALCSGDEGREGPAQGFFLAWPGGVFGAAGAAGGAGVVVVLDAGSDGAGTAGAVAFASFFA